VVAELRVEQPSDVVLPIRQHDVEYGAVTVVVLRVWGLRSEGLESRVKGLGFRVQSLGSRVSGQGVGIACGLWVTLNFSARRSGGEKMEARRQSLKRVIPFARRKRYI
jgi:hypothetical protein